MKRFIATIAAGQTDSELVAAVSGRSIHVCALVMICGGTATTITFNSKGSSGVGTAISPAFPNGVNGGAVLPQVGTKGWFETITGEALTCTTGAGASTTIIGLYTEEIP